MTDTILDRDELSYWSNWKPVPDGLYFVKKNSEGRNKLHFQAFADGEITRIMDLGDRLEQIGIDISPDRNKILFSKPVIPESDIMIVPIR